MRHVSRLCDWIAYAPVRPSMTAGDGGEGTFHLWSRWLYLRILGVLYVAVFLSLEADIVGLVGPNGIFPAHEQLSAIASRHPGALGRFLAAPSIVWLSTDAWLLRGMTWVGLTAAALVVLNLWPRAALACCWVCHLSFVSVAPQFAWYASDGLLLESALLAIFLAPPGFRPRLGGGWPASRWIMFFNAWLLFRLMLETGMSKILGGDAAWRSLDAMRVFLETSPFPTWVAWFAHKLPASVHRGMTAYVLFAEIGGSVLLFCGARLRRVALAAWIVLQTGILLTGNFNTFNYNAIALAILVGGAGALTTRAVSDPTWRARAAHGLLAVLFVATVVTTLQFFHVPAWAIPAPLRTLTETARAFKSANAYVLYPMIPRERRVITFEGSNDGGATWRPYPFRYQTQKLDARPRFIAPFHPRFDREAGRVVETEPLPPYTAAPFVFRTARRLLEGEPSVVALFADDPFPAARPEMIRAVLDRYHFTDLPTLRRTGEWWSRERLGEFGPTIVRDPLTAEIRHVAPEEHR